MAELSEYGLYGLAVMGQNFALNMASHGFKAYRDAETRERRNRICAFVGNRPFRYRYPRPRGRASRAEPPRTRTTDHCETMTMRRLVRTPV